MSVAGNCGHVQAMMHRDRSRRTPNDESLSSTNLSGKIAVVHPGTRWRGGAGAVAAWSLQALKDDHDITLFTFAPVSVAEVNEFYGTHLSSKDFSVSLIPMPAILRGRLFHIWYLKRLWVMRYCRSHRDRFDLFFSTHYEMDFGRPGIQYVHSPAFAARAVSRIDSYLDRSLRSWQVRSYRRVSSLILGCSIERIKRNVTLVNSDWTGGFVERAYGIRPITIYPPVQSDFPTVPWETRQQGFVCIGRLVENKRVEVVAEIVRRVREAGWDVHLHVVGSPVDSNYSRRIGALRQENSSWMTVEGRLGRDKLVKLVTSHRYGIHGKPDEHFGIGPAEMVKGGCIVFVPDGGGQVEIVGEKVLRYGDVNEAVGKIVHVLRDGNLQNVLRKHLARRAQQFSAEHFMGKIRQVVNQALSGGTPWRPPAREGT